jgi:hypothetical protein
MMTRKTLYKFNMYNLKTYFDPYVIESMDAEPTEMESLLYIK